MSDTLFVHGLVLHAHHGVHAHETRIGQPFVLDLILELDLQPALDDAIGRLPSRYQWSDAQYAPPQALIEILSELTGLDAFLEIEVGRRNDSRSRLSKIVFAKSTEFT